MAHRLYAPSVTPKETPPTSRHPAFRARLLALDDLHREPGMSETIENDSTQSVGARAPASVPRAGGQARARARQALAALRTRQPAVLLACLLPALWLVAA